MNTAAERENRPREFSDEALGRNEKVFCAPLACRGREGFRLKNMITLSKSSAPATKLYHAPSSYYSMIARLALAEAGIAAQPVRLDIHRRMEQLEPAYVALNPSMTVPTLVLPDQVLADSRDIVAWSFGEVACAGAAGEAINRQYTFPIEDLTMSWLMGWNPVARRALPRKLQAANRQLLRLAARYPELAAVYRRRAEVFAARSRTFGVDGLQALFARRWSEAEVHLDWLEQTLDDGRPFLFSNAFGPADAVWIAFLGRIRFIGKGAAIDRRPALRLYEATMQARPAWAAAEIWTRIHWFKLLRQILA